MSNKFRMSQNDGLGRNIRLQTNAFISMPSILGWRLSSSCSSWQQPKDSLWGSSQPIRRSNTMTVEPAGGVVVSVASAWRTLDCLVRGLHWLDLVEQHQQVMQQPTSSPTAETSRWNLHNMDSVLLRSSTTLWDPDSQLKCNIYFYLKSWC